MFLGLKSDLVVGASKMVKVWLGVTLRVTLRVTKTRVKGVELDIKAVEFNVCCTKKGLS